MPQHVIPSTAHLALDIAVALRHPQRASGLAHELALCGVVDELQTAARRYADGHSGGAPAAPLVVTMAPARRFTPVDPGAQGRIFSLSITC